MMMLKMALAQSEESRDYELTVQVGGYEASTGFRKYDTVRETVRSLRHLADILERAMGQKNT